MLVFYINYSRCNMEVVLDLGEGNVCEKCLEVLETLNFNCVIG